MQHISVRLSHDCFLFLFSLIISSVYISAHSSINQQNLAVYPISFSYMSLSSLLFTPPSIPLYPPDTRSFGVIDPSHGYPQAGQYSTQESCSLFFSLTLLLLCSLVACALYTNGLVHGPHGKSLTNANITINGTTTITMEVNLTTQTLNQRTLHWFVNNKQLPVVLTNLPTTVDFTVCISFFPFLLHSLRSQDLAL